MGIKYIPTSNTWTVSYSKRPKPKMPPISRRKEGIKSEKEAKKIWQRLVAEVEEKALVKLSPLWCDVLPQYFESALLRGISKKTIATYKYVLEAHTLADWGSLRVDAISSRNIVDLISTKLEDSTPGNKGYVLKGIRQVFGFAEDQGWVVRNPTPKMHFKKQEKLKGVLTKDQVEILLNQARELECNWYPHWAMALYTGMRNGELYALTWDKVDLENGFIKVDCAWNNIDGFKSTKSGNDRILEIAPDLMVLLKELKLAHKGIAFVLPRSRSWDKGEQARELRMFLQGLGLPEVRFHDLRATWATLLLSKGVEPIKVMKMGGWQDIKTMQIYVRKAGVDIRGCMSDFSLHSPFSTQGKVIQAQFGSSL